MNFPEHARLKMRDSMRFYNPNEVVYTYGFHDGYMYANGENVGITKFLEILEELKEKGLLGLFRKSEKDKIQELLNLLK